MATKKCGVGACSKRIVIETDSPTKDAYGQNIEGWSTLANVWAEVKYAIGDEKFEGSGDAQEERGIEKVTFKIRYRTDVTVKERVVFRSKNWDIRNIRIDNDQWLFIDAQTRDV